jgi:hypothetical protein
MRRSHFRIVGDGIEFIHAGSVVATLIPRLPLSVRDLLADELEGRRQWTDGYETGCQETKTGEFSNNVTKEESYD